MADPGVQTFRDFQEAGAQLARWSRDGKALSAFPIRDVQPAWPDEDGVDGVPEGLVTELPGPESLGRHTAVAVAATVVRAEVTKDARRRATEVVRVLSSELRLPLPL